MTDSAKFALFVLKRARVVGLKNKKEIFASNILSWISLLPPTFSSSTIIKNVRKRIANHLAPFMLPLAHVDTMTTPFVDVSSRYE